MSRKKKPGQAAADEPPEDETLRDDHEPTEDELQLGDLGNANGRAQSDPEEETQAFNSKLNSEGTERAATADAAKKTENARATRKLNDEIRQGVLYAVEDGQDGAKVVRLMAGGGEKKAGDGVEADEDTEVYLNNVETTLDDLKRGDRVTITGDPVSKIEASR